MYPIRNLLPYHELDLKDYNEPELENIITSNETKWDYYYNFLTALVPLDLLHKDEFFKQLYNKYPYTAGIIKLPKSTCYNWHKDSSRGVCINTLLSFNGESHCFFAPDKSEFSHEFIELKYKPYRRYVFNNQIEHMVINFEENRYVLTLEFTEDKYKLGFEKLLVDIVPIVLLLNIGDSNARTS